MQSPDGNQLWCPGQSLWSLITEHVSGSELPKIHTALGHSLVDMYTDAHTEVEMWYKMWQESQQGINSSRTGTPLPHQQASPLADPPAIKELVRAEVKMLLQTLRERASRGGRDCDELLFQYRPETVDYALSHLDSCSRNCTNPGDTDNGSRPSSHCSVRSIAEAEIEEMRDKLNVSDIDQVVDRLRSVLMEECEALYSLIRHFKGNIKQKCLSQCEFDKSEPSLAELRELRGAIQMDLKLYPSSLDASPSSSSPFPLKGWKTRFRLPAGQKVSDETLRVLSTTPALRPHPPPPLSHPKPRPPPGTPPSKTSASLKLIQNSSLSRTHGQQRRTSASTGAQKTPISNRITTSGQVSCHFIASLPGSGSDKMMVKTHCSLSQERESNNFHCRTPTSSPSFQIKTPKISPIHETHLSSHRSIHGLSRKCDLSQTERKSSPEWRSENINTVPSSPHCEDAGSYSNSTDHGVSATGKSETQNGRQNSTCKGGLGRGRKSSSETFQSETGSSPAQTGSRKSNIGTDRNKNNHLGKDVTQQQSLVAAYRCPEATQINGQFLTSPKRPLEDTTSQLKGVQETQTDLEFTSKFYQPVPPARMST